VVLEPSFAILDMVTLFLTLLSSVLDMLMSLADMGLGFLTGCLAPVPAEVTLLLTKVTVSVDPPTFSVSASLTPPLSWSDWISARSLWCLSLLEVFLGVAGPDPGLLGDDRLTQLPLTFLLATVFIPPRTDPGAAEGSSELVLQLEKEELLCFLLLIELLLDKFLLGLLLDVFLLPSFSLRNETNWLIPAMLF